jgi:Na+-transporting NADH:ubiquinone oxidoreductase subunit NqrC
MSWITEHWKDILAIIGGIVTLASLIVKLTPTQKDDNILAKIIKILSIIGIFNPDGSSIGKKEEK